MTRKDFEMIAKRLNRELEIARGNHEIHGAAAIQSLAVSMARDLVTTNPRFDAERFLAACGVKVHA